MNGPKSHVVIFTLTFLSAVLLFSGTALAGQKLSGGAVMIARNAAGAGGGRAGSPAFNLAYAAGETGTGLFSGGDVRLYSGYAMLASQPGSVVSVTAVAKSSGALTLNWLSPGFDGFQGNVLNGFYRVDYSSDPAHIFSPASYKLEFSTSVEAQRQQFLALDGLQPNTTYYAKIYLGESRKFFSENSSRGEESTLAAVAVNPVVSGVSPCGAVISWTLPPGGAEGYRTEASSTNFGSLSPGGETAVSSAFSGQSLSLALTGLTPATTYFFNVASLNRQGHANFTTVIGTVTPPGVCDPMDVSNIAAACDAWSRAVALSWVNPSAPGPQGVLVVLSTNPSVAPGEVSRGAIFNSGQVLSDGSLVRATAAAAGFADSGLILDTTYFYHLFARYEGLTYSVGVSTSVFLDLPPTAPAGLASAVSGDRTWITLNWQPVAGNLDGSLFFSTGAPRPVELAWYRIDRATSVLNANWVAIATVPVSDCFFSEDIPEPGRTYFYRVSAVDSFGVEDIAMAVDTEQNLYALSPDGVTRLKIPPELSRELMLGAGPERSYVLVRAVEEPSDGPNKVFTSVRFEALAVPGNRVLERFQFSKPEIGVFLKYEVSGGRVVPSGSMAAAGGVHVSAAADSLGMFWNNTQKYVKLFGRVDAAEQTVSVKSSMTGGYQIRSMARGSGADFDISGLSNRVITPNGDGLNDASVFTFYNPNISGFSGKIFDVEGAFVADMTPGPVSDSLQWNGKGNGRTAQGGVYVYQIRAEEKIFNGTLLVIK